MIQDSRKTQKVCRPNTMLPKKDKKEFPAPLSKNTKIKKIEPDSRMIK